MSWSNIREIQKYNFVEIGNHSHTHEYLVDESSDLIKDDIKKSIEIFEKKLGHKSKYFSYPFGEYSLEFKKIIKDLGFKYAFGQHSGVIDETKDFWELPRYPINEKYGEMNRFRTLMKTLPLKYKSIAPNERYLTNTKNPPNIKIEFYENINKIYKSFGFENQGGFDAEGWFTGKWDTYDDTYEDEVFNFDGSTNIIEVSKALENGVEYNVYKNNVRIDDPNYDGSTIIENKVFNNFKINFF